MKKRRSPIDSHIRFVETIMSVLEEASRRFFEMDILKKSKNLEEAKKKFIQILETVIDERMMENKE